MTRNSCFRLALTTVAVVLTAEPEMAWADGYVSGHGRFEKIKGNPSAGYIGIAENDAWLSPAGDTPIGPSYRLGGDGYYFFSAVPAGTYSIHLDLPDFFIRPAVLPNVVVVDGQVTTANVEIPVDYSTYTWPAPDWTGPDTSWYQTFTATGSGVTGVSFILADRGSAQATVSILKDNGEPNVINWEVLGTRLEYDIDRNTDNWVRWRSGEIPLIPGVQYAVRVTGIGGETGMIQPYKLDKGSQSYTGGQAYDSQGNPQDFDLNYVVFADNDGTVVTVNKRSMRPGYYCSPGYTGSRWGQTFIAQGDSLAGADVYFIGFTAPDEWSVDMTWKVREGGPTGTQIAPTKRSKAVYYTPDVGLSGVSYNPDQVPLVRGQTYFIEFSSETESFKPHLMQPSPGMSCDGGNEPDSYDGGMAYRDNVPYPNDDLSMTIVEYQDPAPFIELNKSSISRSTYLGDNLTYDTFTVRNVGGETLDYNITDDDTDWLWESPTSGSLPADQADLIMVNYGVGTLPVGTHNATITVSGNAINGPQQIAVTVDVYTVGPDLDGDADVDQEDFGLFQVCLSGSGVAPTESCTEADFENDDDVDQNDFAIFEECMSGANIPAARDCAD